MGIALIFLGLAFVLYTVAVWSEKIQHELKLWMVTIFYLAFSADLFGTYYMEIAVPGFSWSLHVCAGYFALVVMFIHALLAVFAINYRAAALLFGRYSVWAWAIWILAGLAGSPYLGKYF